MYDFATMKGFLAYPAPERGSLELPRRASDAPDILLDVDGYFGDRRHRSPGIHSLEDTADHRFWGR
jgi:hypothetical protein